MKNVIAATVVVTLLLGGAVPPAAAKARKAADLILRNGAVYAVEPAGRWSEAVAIRDGKIIAIGSNASANAFKGPETRIVDLKGRMVMPGLIDSHVHLGEAAAQLVAYNCSISPYASYQELLKAVRTCAQDKGPDDWIIGQHWGSALLPEIERHGALAELDAASGGRPVDIRNDTIHDHWVNSRALTIAGITKSTPNPEGGEIGRDPKTGEPNGLLIESARALVEVKVPALLAPLTVESMAKGVRYLNSQGVTGFNDAAVLDGSTMMISTSDLYHQLDQQGKLTARAGMSMIVGGFTRAVDNSPAGLDRVYANRDAYRSKQLSMDFAKILLDGVMVTHTAVFVDPYLPDKEHGANFHGEPKMSQDDLNRLVTELDRRGIAAKIHVAGDGSVKMALDAVAAARKMNGDDGPIHTLAHAGYVKPEDIGRMAALRVGVDASPTVWYPGPILTATEAVIGKDRADHYFPLHTYDEKGILVAGGTDWSTLPGEFSSLWDGMEGMVTRRNPQGRAPGSLWPEQAVDVATMVRFYTINGAKALNVSKITGSLVPGKSADLIVLDQNLFKISPEKISETKVEMTVFEGRIVYER